jgi:hypothetical protein
MAGGKGRLEVYIAAAVGGRRPGRGEGGRGGRDPMGTARPIWMAAPVLLHSIAVTRSTGFVEVVAVLLLLKVHRFCCC